MPFMRFLAVILIVAIFCVALIFTYQNKDQTASLTLGSHTTDPIPVFIVILGSFLVGVIFTSIIGIIEGMKLRVANARLKRKNKRLQMEVDALRNLPLSGPGDQERPPEPPAPEEEGAL
ncbi:MAG: lipopolysaccharide assembly LapA domain-containing protein [Acidobacteriota bacterium]